MGATPDPVDRTSARLSAVSEHGPADARPPAASSAGLAIEAHAAEGQATLSVHGEADLRTAPELERALQDAAELPVRRIVLDLAGLGFIDSSGLNVLCRTQRRAELRGQRLVLANVSAPARRLFSLTGFSPLTLIQSAEPPPAGRSNPL
ncbi:MAG: STAS domain-containing protein [Solirubrobacteraceae bacterium]